MNSQSSDVDGKGDEYLVVVLYVASKTAIPPSPPLGLLVIYLLFIYHLLFIYYLFISKIDDNFLFQKIRGYLK